MNVDSTLIPYGYISLKQQTKHVENRFKEQHKRNANRIRQTEKEREGKSDEDRIFKQHYIMPWMWCHGTILVVTILCVICNFKTGSLSICVCVCFAVYQQQEKLQIEEEEETEPLGSLVCEVIGASQFFRFHIFHTYGSDGRIFISQQNV